MDVLLAHDAKRRNTGGQNMPLVMWPQYKFVSKLNLESSSNYKLVSYFIYILILNDLVGYINQLHNRTLFVWYVSFVYNSISFKYSPWL